MNEQENLTEISTDKTYTATILSDPSELGDSEENKKIVTKTAIVFAIAGLLYQGSQLLLAFLLGKFAPEITEKYGSNLTMLLILATDLLVLLPAFFLLSKNIPAVKSKPSKIKPETFVVSLFICYFAAILGSMVGSRLSYFITGDNTSLLAQALGGGSTLLRLLVAGIVAPICEELVFRKLLIDRFSRFGNRFAVIASGIMFGLFHLNLQQFFYAMILGFIFGYIYVKTRNILHSIILHIIFNSFSSVVILWAMEGYGTDRIKTMIYNLAIVLEFAFAMIGCVLWVIYKSQKKIKVTENAVEPGKVSYAFVNIGLWVFYIAMIALTVFITVRTATGM